jgi:hypothetical protein
MNRIIKDATVRFLQVYGAFYSSQNPPQMSQKPYVMEDRFSGGKTIRRIGQYSELSRSNCRRKREAPNALQRVPRKIARLS